MNNLTETSTARMHNGTASFHTHPSTTCHCDMAFSIFIPEGEGPFPVLWWLSGLTCTAENFTTKAAAQKYAAQHKLIIVAPDTSPRGDNIANDESYDLGQGAGFYLNATQDPWKPHFQMYDYIVHELPQIIADNFPADMTRQSIFGHSMGGHGALTIALKNPGRYKSVSAFSPIVAPTQCPWGHKALTAYLGDDQNTWKAHDTVALIPDAKERLPLLIDQGGADNFLEEQLKPQLLEAACKKAGHPLILRHQPGYDHSYYFIATFMEDHINHHAKALRA